MIPIANPQIEEAEKARVLDVLDSGHLADGPEVRAFEEEFSDVCGTAHAIATSNGTTALHTALEALGLGPGDRVVTTPFSFVASANAIRLCGATPVFADVDPRTFNLDPDAVEATIEAHDGAIDAILAVHLYGLPAPMEELAAVAADYDCHLVEDAAQAHGATLNGRHVGSFGDVGCFSFYPTKNVTTGEGGMIVTDRDDVSERARRFINHGRTDTYDHAEVGHNFRMTSVAGAIGREQLDRLSDYVAARRANARTLTRLLADTDAITPTEPEGMRHAYNQYTIRHPDRDELRDHLAERGVGTGVYYPTPIHKQPAYEGVSADAPVAERVAEEVLSVPIHPTVSDDDLATVADAVASFDGVESPSLVRRTRPESDADGGPGDVEEAAVGDSVDVERR